MKQIIQNQTISFDTHQAGDGRKINREDLHMHKRMNDKKFKGVNIKIPLDPDRPIDYSGNNSADAQEIISEIKSVFKKKPAKVKEMAKYIANRISRYSQDMDVEDSKMFLEKSAKAIAKHFDLNPKIEDKIIKEISNYLSYYVSYHEDEDGKLFYIKQDVKLKKIKLGDDLEKLLHDNNE